MYALLSGRVTKTCSKKNSTCRLVGLLPAAASAFTRATSSLGSHTANSSFGCFGNGDIIFRREGGLASGMGEDFFNKSGDCQPTGFRSFANPCRQSARDVKSDHFFIGGMLVWHDDEESYPRLLKPHKNYFSMGCSPTIKKHLTSACRLGLRAKLFFRASRFFGPIFQNSRNHLLTISLIPIRLAILLRLLEFVVRAVAIRILLCHEFPLRFFVGVRHRSNPPKGFPIGSAGRHRVGVDD